MDHHALPSPHVHRAPRKWTYISTDDIIIPPLHPVTNASFMTLITSAISVLGLVVTGLLLRRVLGSASSFLLFGFVFSGIAFVGSVVTFAVQQITTRRNARNLCRLYTALLSEKDTEAYERAQQELALREANDPPLRGAFSKTEVWQRKANDPDFLCVRIGLGPQPPNFHVTFQNQQNVVALPAPKVGRSDFAALEQDARLLVTKYALIGAPVSALAKHDAPGTSETSVGLAPPPVTVPLREHTTIAIISQNKAEGTCVAMSIAGQVAFQHAPSLAKCAIFARLPAIGIENNVWGWTASLKTTYGTRPATQPSDQDSLGQMLLMELLQRETAYDAQRNERQRVVALPHLVVIVDDSMQAEMQSSAINALALIMRRGVELGATLVTVVRDRSSAPDMATLLIDVDTQEVIIAKPTPPAPQKMTAFDEYDAAQWKQLSAFLASCEPESEAALQLSNDVRLLNIILRGDPRSYDVLQKWRTSPEKFTIPLGYTLGHKILNLDFDADGPHGLLIGQTGSGKSELLRSIIAGLAITYSPQQVNFVLVDYKGGLALEAFRNLPHTVAFLTNMVEQGQTARFLTLLRAEITERQRAKKAAEEQHQGDGEHGEYYTPPKLFVVIDEFAELVSSKNSDDPLFNNLLSIVRLGRELGIHLLFAAQRPDASIIGRLRGYVQYRICLRTNTPEDSNEVLGRPDAAQLPLAVPGRGYLLHGDNQLTQFQSARVALPVDSDKSVESGKLLLAASRPLTPASKPPILGVRPSRSEPKTMDDLIARHIIKTVDDASRDAPVNAPGYRKAKRWPESLPSPDMETPTPLVLLPSDAQTGLPVTPEKDHPDAHHPDRRFPFAVPLGIYDRPATKQQGWRQVDLLGYQGPLTGGPLVIVGDFGAGKTTTLQTLLAWLVVAHTPEQLRIYGIGPADAFGQFDTLGHFVDFASTETGMMPVNRIDGQDATEVRAFFQRVERMMQLPAASRPAILFFVDDYDELIRQMPVDAQNSLFNIAHLATRKTPDNVFLVLTTATPASYDGVKTLLFNAMRTRIVLAMNNVDKRAEALGKRLPFIPESVPGRGFIVDYSGNIDEIQIAVPVAGTTSIERQKQLKLHFEQAKR